MAGFIRALGKGCIAIAVCVAHGSGRTTTSAICLRPAAGYGAVLVTKNTFLERSDDTPALGARAAPKRMTSCPPAWLFEGVREVFVDTLA